MKRLKVVLTGGPCGGKTTSIQKIEQEFSEKGYHVIIVPEAATILINSGIRPFGAGALTMYDFQKYVMRLQLYLESLAEEYAKSSNKEVIILCDRGLLDDKAYVSQEEFKELTKEFQTTEFELLSRYDIVLHLRTIAFGKEELYTTSNNSARTETKEEAREKDQRTLAGWLAHDNLVILGNECDFATKIHNAITSIYHKLNIAHPLQKQEKYLVENIDFKKLQELPFETFYLEQYYLFDNDKEICLRKCQKNNEIKYSENIKEDTNNSNERLISRRKISEQEYFKRIPKEQTPIKKTRYTFAYLNQNFRLDIFENDLQILEIEDTVLTQKRELPNFLKVIEKVDLDIYKNANLFKQQNKKEKELLKK